MLKRCDLFWSKSAILGFLKSPFDPKKDVLQAFGGRKVREEKIDFRTESQKVT